MNKKDFPPIPQLPKITNEDYKLAKPGEHFNLPGRYKFMRLLGHGAYGLVCSALDHQLGHSVAIKRINQINSLLVARRTLRELKLLRHFKGHPNIISLLDMFKTNPGNFDELYIVQELMDADLCHIIQSKYSLTEEHIRRFVYHILRGLKAIHSAGVIHRDLKPGNLLWKHTGEMKICDFGLARGLAEPLEGKDVNMTNYVATRWYRPPEILLYRSKYGKALDVWSVGCILAELYGRKVFLPGQSGFEQLHLILQKLGTPSEEILSRIPSSKSKAYLSRLPRYPRFPLERRFPNASAEGINLLGRMLEFDPNDRITVDEALEHPFLSRYHDPHNEPTSPHFNFDFDTDCTTLAQLKGYILEELKLFCPQTPTMGLNWKISHLSMEEQEVLLSKAQNLNSLMSSNSSIPNICSKSFEVAKLHLIPMVPKILPPPIPEKDSALRGRSCSLPALFNAKRYSA